MNGSASGRSAPRTKSSALVRTADLIPWDEIGLEPSQYDRFLGKARKIIERVRRRVLADYWALGEVLSQANATAGFETREARYGVKLMDRFARDLGVDKRTLYHCLQFYEKVPPAEYRRLVDAGMVPPTTNGKLSAPDSEIESGAHGHYGFLTWEKVRYIVTLPDHVVPEFIESAIRGDHLGRPMRTAEDVKDIVRFWKEQNGYADGYAKPSAQGMRSEPLERLFTRLRRATFADQAVMFALWVERFIEEVRAADPQTRRQMVPVVRQFARLPERLEMALEEADRER